MTAGRRATRLLMTADPIGGVWTYALELVRALDEHGVEVVLATMGAPLSAGQRRAAAQLPNAELAERAFALEWMPEPWRDVDAAGDWLLALAQRHAPDAVHVNGFAHAALPFRAPVLCVAHSCVATWMRAVRGREAGPEWAEYRARAARGLRAADAVAAPTAAILREILAAHDVVRSGHAIPNGRAAEGFAARDKAPIVLAAGRLWDEAKGLATLDACAGALRWAVCVAGPVAPPGGAAARPPRHVEALGELPPGALAAWMRRASIFAHPARYEPFGLTPLEAALAGCALVLGDLATLREVWGDAAVYVPPGDPAALGHALEALIRDPLRRGALAARARARALALTPQRMAAAYHRLYAELRAAARPREVCA